MGHSSAVGLVLVLLVGCSRSATKLEGTTMNTSWRVTIDESVSNSSALRDEIQTKLDHIEQVFSNWRSDSAVCVWNASRTTDFQSVPREVAEVVSFALQAARDTNGALDVTLAPLIDLWGFGPTKRDHLPTDAAITAAMNHCGWQKLEVKLDPPMLRKTDPLIEINLSTLVEGYASDVIADWLQAHGYSRVLVDVGGAINARGKTWLIAVQTPNATTGEHFTTVPMRDEAVTTAGTYRKRFEHEDKQLSHILDPRTGCPVEHSLVSVTVFAKRAVIADGFDTGLLVLGPQTGRETAQKLGVRAVFVQESRTN